MTSMSKAIIDVEINTSGAAASLRSLQAQLNAFQSALNKGNLVQGAAAKEYAKSLSALVNSSGYFTAETTRMRTSAAQLDDTLRKGKATFGDYFSSLRKGTAAYNAANSLAQARAAALQTQFVATGAAARGFQDALAIRPLTAFNDAAAVAAQRMAIQRALFHQATTSMINYGKNVQWAGRQLMVGFTVPLTILGAIAAKTFTDLEKQVISFKKVYGDLFTAPGELTANLDAIKELGMELTKYGLKLSDTVKLASQAAAAGNKNAELIDVTREASRLAVLGQMDQQKALEATISLQNAYGIAAKDLAENINFLNMVENQTVLTLNDMTEAIPRVAPVIKGLGGDVKDMAVLLAAMKEGGVSAAQGANALKSGLASLINPTNRAVESLSSMGINLNKIIQVNKGDLMGTVRAFGEALNTLDDFGRQQAIEKVFGKYQFARLSALFTNITKEGTQASRVMELAGLSAKDLAETASKELSAIEESPATKMTKAIEELKQTLVPLGESFAKVVAPIAEIFTRLFKNIDRLPDFVKNIGAIGAVLIGLVIPAGTMFLGLLMNLTGTLLKFGNIFQVAFQGFLKGGFSGAINAIKESFRYLSLAEIDAARAAEQLAAAGVHVDAALRDQVINAGNARQAIDTLSGAYQRLIVRMQEAIALSSATFGVPGAAMGRAGAAGAAARSGMRFTRIARNSGGPIPYLSGGGFPTVPGTGNTDTVPAMLTPGEFVVNKQAAQQNLPLLHAINSGNVQGLNRGGGVATPGKMNYGMPAWMATAMADQKALEMGLALPGAAATRALAGAGAQGRGLAEKAHFGNPQLNPTVAKELRLLKPTNQRIALAEELVRAGFPAGALTDDWATVTRKLNQAANRNSNEVLSVREAVEQLAIGRETIYPRAVGPAMQRLGVGPDDFVDMMVKRLSAYPNPEARFTDAIFTQARNDALKEMGVMTSPTITGARISTKVDLQEEVGRRLGLDALQSKGIVTEADIAREMAKKGFRYENGIITSPSGLKGRIGESSPFAGSTHIFANAGGMIPGVQYFLGGIPKNQPGVRPAAPLQTLTKEEIMKRPHSYSYGSFAVATRGPQTRQFVNDYIQSLPVHQRNEAMRILEEYGARIVRRNAKNLQPGEILGHTKGTIRDQDLIGDELNKILSKSGLPKLTDVMSTKIHETHLTRALVRNGVRKVSRYVANYDATSNLQANVGTLKIEDFIKRNLQTGRGRRTGKYSKIFDAAGVPADRRDSLEIAIDREIKKELRKHKGYLLSDNPGTGRITFDEIVRPIIDRAVINSGGTKTGLKELAKRNVIRRNSGGSILGGMVNHAKNFYGVVTAASRALFEKSLGSWQSGQMRAVRETPEMRAALMGGMGPLTPGQQITRGTTLGLSRGSEFSAAEQRMIMDAARSGNVESLIGRTIGMQGPISFTTGESRIARNAMATNADANRVNDLRFQHKNNKRLHENTLGRIKYYREVLADPNIGNVTREVTERQLKEQLDIASMYSASQKKIGREIKALAPRGIQYVEIRGTTAKGDIGYAVKDNTGSFMGKKLNEQEIISSKMKAQITGARIDENGVLILETAPVSPMATIQRRRAQVSIAKGKSLDEVIFARDAAGKLNASPSDLLTLIRNNPNITERDLNSIAKYHRSRILDGTYGKFDKELGYKTVDPEQMTWRSVMKEMEKRGVKIQRRNTGGFISPTLQSGSKNIVPGMGNTDTVPAMLTPGEFVINKQATKDNLPLLHAINSGNPVAMNIGGMISQRFNDGGEVTRARIVQLDGQHYIEYGNGQSEGPFRNRASATKRMLVIRREQAKAARQSAKAVGGPRGMGMGRQALGMALSMGSMVPMMAGDPNTGKFMGMDSNTMMMSMMGAGTLLSLPGKMAGGVAAVLAPLALFALSLKNSREALDKAAESAYKLGSNLGGSADRMEQVSQATGYVFSGQKDKDRLFRFTGKEKKDMYQFSGYFESERGQKYIQEIQKLTSSERYAKIASELSFAIADGMDPDKAKAYGVAIAAYAGDAFLKQRIVRDFARGKYMQAPTAIVDLVTERSRAQKKQQEKMGTYDYSILEGPGAAAAKGLGFTGMNATYGDVAIAGGVGALAAAGTGLAIGAAIGSAVPVVGTILIGALGAIIGGVVGYIATAGNREKIMANTKLATFNIGSSAQILKEATNAESRLLELRRKGIIETDLYIAKNKELEDAKNAAAKTMSQAIEAVYKGGDIDAAAGQIKNQLVLAGYAGDQAEAIAETTDFKYIAQQFYGPDVNVDEIMNDPSRKNIVLGTINEIFAGLTPENAGQQIPRVMEAWKKFAGYVENGIYDAAMPLTEQETVVRAISLGDAVEEAYASASPEDAIVAAEDVIKSDVLRLTKEEKGNLQQDGKFRYYEDENGVRVRGVDKATARQEAIQAIQKQNEGMNVNAAISILDDEDTRNLTISAIAAMEDAKKHGGDWQVQLANYMAANPNLTLDQIKEELGSRQGGIAGFFGLEETDVSGLQAITDEMEAIANMAAEGGAFRGITTMASRAGLAWKDWAVAQETFINGLGISVNDLAVAMSGITDKEVLDTLANGSDDVKMKFAELTSVLSDAKYNAIDLGSATKYMLNQGISADQTKAQIDSFFKYAESAVKKFGKKYDKKTASILKGNFADVSTQISNYLEAAASGTLQAGITTFEQYFDAVSQEVATLTSKMAGLKDKSGKPIMNKSGKFSITNEVVTTLFGQEIRDPAAAVEAMKAAYGDKNLGSSYLEIVGEMKIKDKEAYLAWVELMNMEDKAKQGKIIRALKAGQDYYTDYRALPKRRPFPVTIDISALSRYFNAKATGDGAGFGGGDQNGAGEKSIPQQIKDMLKESNKLFDTLYKLYSKNRGKFMQIAAGPFGPEFVDFLMQQGDKATKILKQDIDKIMELYNQFEQAKIADLASESIFNPFFRGLEIREQGKQFSQIAGLSQDGFSKEQQNYIVEKVGIKRLTILEKLQKINKKDRTERQQNELNAIQKDVDAAKEQSKYAVAYQQLSSFQEKAQESTEKLAIISSESQKLYGIDASAIQSLQEYGLGLESLAVIAKDGKTAIQNLAEGVRLLNLAEKIGEISQSLKESYQSAKNVLEISRMGIFGDMAQELGSVVGSLNVNGEELKKIAAMLLLNKKAIFALRTDEQKLTDTLDTQTEVAQARLKVLEESNYYNQVEIDRINDANAVIQHSIDLENDKKDIHNENINRYQDELNKEQELYDNRIKALDEVERINESIRRQQQSQLNVAQALSSGDIAAAAKAMQDAQQEAAQNQQQTARDAMQKKHESYVEEMQGKIKDEKKQIEGHDEVIADYQEKIKNNNYKIYDIQKKINDSREEERKQQEKLYKIELLRTINQTKMAILNAAMLNDISKVSSLQGLLNEQLKAVGETPEDRKEFFGDIGGAQTAGQLASAENIASTAPGTLIAQKTNQILDTFGSSVSEIFKNWAQSEDVKSAKQQFIDLIKPSLGLKKEDKVEIGDDGSLKINGKEATGGQYASALAATAQGMATAFSQFLQKKSDDFATQTQDSMLKTAKTLLSLPKLAEAIMVSFKAANNELLGNTKAAKSGYRTAEDILKKVEASTTIPSGTGPSTVFAPPSEEDAWSQNPWGWMYGGKVSYKGSRESAPGMMYGGKMKKFATGSFVPGVGMTDKVPALLTPGEFVVRKPVAQAYGPLLQALNGNVFPTMNSRASLPKGTMSQISARQNAGNRASQYNNYQVNVNVAGTNASPDEIANRVLTRIADAGRMNVRSIRGN